MGRILGSWSGMKKYLEREMLAESLKGRIKYTCAQYDGMDGGHIFEVLADGRSVKRFSWETVNSYFIKNSGKNPDLKQDSSVGVDEYWAGFLQALYDCPINSRTEYTDDEFCKALKMYRNQNIRDSIYSDDPIQRMFAVLDRRLGKRTLAVIKKDIDRQPGWLHFFYDMRMRAEGI